MIAAHGKLRQGEAMQLAAYELAAGACNNAIIETPPTQG